MKTFEIRVTDENDDNDLSTTTYISEEPEMSADYVMERIEQAINYADDIRFMHGERFIVISPASDDEGYMYDIYPSKKAFEDDEDSLDGGQCTGTISDAIEMAIN